MKIRLATVTLALGLALGLIISTEAQQRALQGTTARLTDTSANALLVGCSSGTNCSGGIKGGPAILSISSSGALWLRGINGTTNGVELHMRPSSGKKAYLTITEDTVADRWAIGTDNGDSKLYFRSGLYTDSVDASLDSNGTFTHNGVLYSGTTTAFQSLTTGDAANSVTLNANTAVLRVTTGGTAADDTLSTINGGADGRNLTICWIAETGAGDGPLDVVVGGVSRVMTLTGCLRLWYDGTSATWRHIY